MNPKTNNRVAVFFSAGGNIGTTNTTYSVAQSLARQTDARIGVLSLNAWDDSTDYLVDPPAFLDTLKPRLAGKMLGDDEELLGRFTEIEKDKLYILAGNRNSRLVREFTIEEIEYLIDRSKTIFDVVLIDAGSHLDNALSVQAIYAADNLYPIINQQPKVLKHFRQQFDDILHPLSLEKQQMNFVLNKYQEKSYLLTDKQIIKELDITDVFTIPYTEDGPISELENKFLYTYSNQKYQASIDLIAQQIGTDMALTLKELATSKKGIFKFGR